MDNWNNVVNSHVVKVFRNIAHDWWGVDVHFYDESGNFKSNGVPFKNPFCHLIQSNTKLAKGCLRFHGENLNGLNKVKTYACKFSANVRAIAIPITVREEYVGAMICSGIQCPIENSRREEAIRNLTRLGLRKADVERCLAGSKIANGHDTRVITDLMNAVVRDVTVYFESMMKQNDTKRKHSLSVDSIRNEKYRSIIGNSTPIKKVFEKLELIENSEGAVLIEGETGTGKELIATAIHYNSVRRDKAFVIQNCSAFSDTILSSELFGHEKGAFTGAVSEKRGLFEVADGGTLFLDEIGDINSEVQGRLLRVLENGTFYRVGGTVEKKVDVRIVSATNKDLIKLVDDGLFRKDLLYRINTIRINTPPLRNRKDDILPIFHSFYEHYTERKNIERKEISPALLNMLAYYNWPGNVRELKNVVEYLVAMSYGSKIIKPEHLPQEIRKESGMDTFVEDYSRSNKLLDVIGPVEKKVTEKALQKAAWNKTVAARELGISRASLLRRIKKYNIC